MVIRMMSVYRPRKWNIRTRPNILICGRFGSSAATGREVVLEQGGLESKYPADATELFGNLS